MLNIFCIRPKGFNVGNDAIFMGLQAAIAEAFGAFVNLISIPATSRYESQAKAGLTSRTVHEINQYGHGVIVGGGTLYENGELDVNLEALRKLEPPLMLFSLSRGRMYNRLDKLVERTDVMSDTLIAGLNRQATWSLARDHATLAHLQGLGLDHARLGGCPTIFLDRLRGQFPEVPQADRRTTLVSVRNPQLMNISLQRQIGIASQVQQIIALLRHSGHDDVRLLCHDHRDIPFAASLAEPYVYIQEPHAYLALLNSCRLNVTYRVHSALPCMALGTPFIKLSYDERAISLMDTVGYGDWNIDIVREPDVPGAVAERLARIDQLPALRQQAQPVWESLRATQDGALSQFAAAVRAFAAQS
jgi:polysaccharide pyruvyl transferase WcaK-like protein